MMSPGRASSGKMTVSSPTAQLAVFTSVTADDHLSIDDRDRSRPQSELLQFLQRLWIFSDVLRGKLDALLRKKLFLLVTGASPGLGIDNHLLRHDLLLAYRVLGCAKSEPKISRPAPKASSSEETRPGGSPFPLHQVSRWSEVQKKLMFGQRDWATGQQSPSDIGNHTTISEGRCRVSCSGCA